METIKQQVQRKQDEMDEKTKQINLLSEKEKALLVEIEEIRGLLSNNVQIK
jgi:hypothetical protein